MIIYPVIKPKIVTSPVLSNLVLWLDADDTDCYPTTGTTWTDISGNGNGGSLVGSTSFSTNPSRFDTNATLVTQAYYLSSGSINFASTTSEFSLEFFVKLRSGAGTTYNSLSGWGQTTRWLSIYGPGSTSWTVRFRDTSGTYHISSTITTMDIQTNWVQVVVTLNSSHTLALYINGSFVENFSTSPSSNIWTISRLAGGYSSGGNYYSLQGSLAVARVYAAVLSADDVFQNFEYDRNKFGL